MISPMNNLRNAVWLMRSTATLLLVVFNFVFFFSPTALAIEEKITERERYQARIDAVLEATPDQKLAHRLQKLKESVTLELSGKVTERVQQHSNEGLLDKVLSFFSADSVINQGELDQISNLKLSIESAYAEAMEEFEQEAEIFNNPKVPELARERYQTAKAEVVDKFDQLIEKLNVLLKQEDGDDQQQALNELIQLLNESQFKKTHTAEDPNKLPWGTPEDKVRKPAETLSELSANLGIAPYPSAVQLASSVTPMAAIAASLKVFEQPGAAELAATIDAPITPEIEALAAELNHNVVDIYTWVHNNIFFVPSHGSLQGAQMTLDTKRGNSMDTASLTIALLRASNIPARYVYGTVEIPAEKIMNWVGGTKDVNAAGALLGQGGIPNVAIISGGKIKSFRLEHVWTEAYVDFEPSRGLKNGARDNWIPLDASFKQYEFTEGMNLNQQVPFDAEGLVANIQANSTVNEDEGWVQGIQGNDLEQSLEQYQQQLQDYIQNQNPDVTIAEVLGLQEVKILEPRPLSAGLPYKHIVTSNTFNEVPNNLRHKFKYTLNTSPNGYISSPFITINEPTVILAGKTLALSFAPATENDEQIIASLLPEPDPDTGNIDMSAVPSALPGYAINVKAEFHISDELKISANAGTIGTELHESLGYWNPSFGWMLSENKIVAGEYHAIALDLQGIDASYLAQLQSNMEATKTKLESDDVSQLSTLTKQRLVGDALQATIVNYFALNNLQDYLAAQQSNIINYRMPSYGKFSSLLSTSYWFGTPRNVSMIGMVMDVDQVLNSNVDKNNNAENRLRYNESVGYRYSAMEHQVPEEMFSTPESQVQGISAVKAIAIAAAQGQKIWTITQENLEPALSSLMLSPEVETEIRNGVNNGKVVTAHERRITLNNWIGEGYIILDPATGAGAYKISGGANGGFLLALMSGALSFFETLMTQRLGENRIWFTDELNRARNFSRLANRLGVLGVIFSLYDVYSSGSDLSPFQFVGQLAVTIGIAVLTAAAISVFALGPILALGISFALAMAGSFINTHYLSLRFIINYRRYV